MTRIKASFIVFLTLFLWFTANLFLQEIDTSINLPAPPVSYIIDAQLFPEKRELQVVEIITWVNNSSAAVDNLRFHLYYNAFSSPKTTLMQEAGIHLKSKEESAALEFGGIEIKRIRLIGGKELTKKMHFVTPDGGNKDDRTVMQVDLEESLEPMQSISMQIEFVLKIPEIFTSTGRAEDYYFMARWFARIGILQKDGNWLCQPYQHTPGFPPDYGDYKVSLTLPEEFIVGASGNLVKTEKNKNGTVSHFFEEKNIRDFTWAAYPYFTRVVEKIKLKGRSRDTIVEVLVSPLHRHASHRYLQALKFALVFYAENLFPYPYRKITLVDPPLKGLMSGGMGYPTLISVGYIGSLPESLKLPELVTIHGLGCQYWCGILGSEKLSEAWLNEGINTFFEMEIMDKYFKDAASYLDSGFIKIDAWEFIRLSYLSLLPMDKVRPYSWKFLNLSQYGNNVSARVGLFLRSLKNYLGQERMYNFFKFYAKKFKYQLFTTDDFIAAFNSLSDEDFSWAFDQFLKGEGRLDQAVYSIESVKMGAGPDRYRNVAIFLRREGYFPVELEIKFENGKKIKSFWKEREKWKMIETENDAPIEYAALDPEFKIVLDKNFLNNSKMRKTEKSGLKRLALKLGFIFQNVLGLLLL